MPVDTAKSVQFRVLGIGKIPRFRVERQDIGLDRRTGTRSESNGAGHPSLYAV